MTWVDRRVRHSGSCRFGLLVAGCSTVCLRRAHVTLIGRRFGGVSPDSSDPVGEGRVGISSLPSDKLPVKGLGRVTNPSFQLLRLRFQLLHDLIVMQLATNSARI